MTRNQLARIIEEEGLHEIDITPEFVYHWWIDLSVALFDCMLLPPCKLKLYRRGEYLGWYQHQVFGRKYKHIVGLHQVELETSLELFVNVLAHEMVHMHQAIYRPDDCAVHGKYFYSFVGVFQQAGLTLKRTYTPDD